MNKEIQTALTNAVAQRLWEHPTPAQIQEASQMVETLWDDDELVRGIPGISARSHQALIYDEAVRRLTHATGQTDS